MNNPEKKSIKNFTVEKVNGDSSLRVVDTLSVEEPLEIRLDYGSNEQRTQKSISVTMRTPGNDADLAIGFLFTEGIISLKENIDAVQYATGDANVIIVRLSNNCVPHLSKTDRNFYTTSSCGVCGKSSIDAVRTVSPFTGIRKTEIKLSSEVICQLPQKLREAQGDFSNTGGIHASGLFTLNGELIDLKEDVGRHNALDKLIGAALMKNMLPLDNAVLLLSGRASFELVQKAAMAGISVVAAIGAPSSLAVELAKEHDITLIGFLRENRFNIYTDTNKILIPTHEDQN